MVKIIHIFFFLLLFPMSVWAQETVLVFKGAVTEANGKGIANVLCKVLNAKDSLLAYSISRSDGQYILKCKKQATKLSFAKMGFATQCIPVEKEKLRYDVQLIEKSYAIDEVVVKADPITRKKDTLNYHVESFRQKEDYSIEDVLKHMPGIEVLPSGQIMYQGNSINKVNIEGLDLMGDQYNQATQNMPVEAVSTIQVMENNQPIRALEGKVHSNRATLNIKLKKNYKMRPFGDAEVGVGGTPVVWDGSLTGIQVARKNQLLFTGALNNRGASLRSLQSGMSNFTGIYTQEPLPAPFLYSATNRRPPISPLYYLDNRSYFAGVNYLHAFTPYSTLRFNLLYNHEGENREDSTRNEYYAADTVSVFDNNRLQAREDVVKGQVRYELNGKKVYVENILSGQWQDMRSYNRNVTNVGSVMEDMHRKPYYLQNVASVNLTTPARIYTLASMVRTYQTRERLSDVWTADNAHERQDYRLNHWFMRHRLSTAFDVAGYPLTLGYIVEYKHNRLHDTQHTATSSYWLHTLEPSYQIEWSGGNIELLLPVEYIRTRCGWRTKNDRKVLFSPSLDVSQRFGYLLRLDASVAYNQNASNTDPWFNGTMMNNYRTFTVGKDSLSVQRTTLANLRLLYLNTVTLLSWNLYAGWTRSTSDHYFESLYLPDYTLITPVWDDRTKTTWSVALSCRKNFREAHLSLSGQTDYSYNKEYVAQNERADYLRYHALHATLSTQWSGLSWFQPKLTMAGNLSWKKPDAFSATDNLLKNAYYSLTMDFYPISKLRLYADFSQSVFEIAHSHYSVNSFLNAGLRYDFHPRWMVSADLSNLLNRKDYEVSLYQGANFQYYRVPLRGREFLVSLRFKY
ncbi:TonB-dependent receptor [Phocaeicola plebeius]|uniref:TonB-dependent receptor n=1 Tax=Phocaeicola plebeius TaxID=310297 RepID=UPI0026F00938|nr:TonB-dependent receptor [Phocaeicola plebeius]